MFNLSLKLARHRCKTWQAVHKPDSDSLRQSQADVTASAQRHLLDSLSDERQPDQFSCGASAAFSVGKFFGVGPKDIGGWKEALGTDLKYSTHPYAIYNYLRSPDQPELPIPDEYPQHDFSDPCGLRVEARDGMTIEDLRQATRAGCPVIVPVQDYGHRREKGAVFQYGHYLIVVRVSMGRVTCQDSTTDNLIEGQESIQEPGRIPIREEDFLKAWYEEDAEGNKFVRFGIVVGPPVKSSKAWRESEHPRGQPDNPGQFGPGGGGSEKPRSDRKPEGESEKLRQSQADPEREVSKLTRTIIGTQSTTQARARAGGEIGPNGEHYPGGAFIATTDMPKRIKQKIEASAKGKVQVDGYKWEVPEPGRMSILDKLGGTVLNPRNGEVNYGYLGYIKATADQVRMYEEIAEKWKAGERWVSVTDYPSLATLKDLARMVVHGVAVPGDALAQMPEEWQKYLSKYKPESAKLQASTAQAGPMRGHPLDGANAEEVMRRVNPKAPSAPAATWDNPNPLHYNQATFPKSVEPGKFSDSLLAAIKEQESRNSFQRLTLPQAYEAVKKGQPNLSYWDFQNGLAKLQADRVIRLGPYTQAIGTHEKPEMLMPLDREYKWYVSR